MPKFKEISELPKKCLLQNQVVLFLFNNIKHL